MIDDGTQKAKCGSWIYDQSEFVSTVVSSVSISARADKFYITEVNACNTSQTDHYIIHKQWNLQR